MTPEEHVHELRAELAILNAKIDEVVPQNRRAQPRREAERDKQSWLWYDSAGWLLLAVGWL